MFYFREQVEIRNISIPEDLRTHARSILGFKSKSSDSENPDSYEKKPSDINISDECSKFLEDQVFHSN